MTGYISLSDLKSQFPDAWERMVEHAEARGFVVQHEHGQPCYPEMAVESWWRSVGLVAGVEQLDCARLVKPIVGKARGMSAKTLIDNLRKYAGGEIIPPPEPENDTKLIDAAALKAVKRQIENCVGVRFDESGKIVQALPDTHLCDRANDKPSNRGFDMSDTVSSARFVVDLIVRALELLGAIPKNREPRVDFEQGAYKVYAIDYELNFPRGRVLTYAWNAGAHAGLPKVSVFLMILSALVTTMRAQLMDMCIRSCYPIKTMEQYDSWVRKLAEEFGLVAPCQTS